MLKSELLRRIVQRQSELERPDVELSVNCILDHIATALAAGRRIEIRGFGVFSKRVRASRIIRNPRTGRDLRVDQTMIIRFKPGSELRERVMQRARLRSGAFSFRRARGRIAGGTPVERRVRQDESTDVA